MSRRERRIVTVEKTTGTIEYMASELFYKGQEYDYSVDIWALGIVLYNVFCLGKSPHIPKHPSDRRFRHVSWVPYSMSDGDYANSMFGGKFLSRDEMMDEEDCDDSIVEFFGKQYDVIQPIVHVIRRCFVPHPINGLNGEVTRPGLQPRLTWAEFYEWTLKHLIGESELSKRQRLISHLKRFKELTSMRALNVSEELNISL